MSNDHWIDAAAQADLRTDDVIGVEVEGRDLALCSVAGEVFATDGLCTHALVRLCDGFLDGHELECPIHQARFDVRDGKALCGPVSDPLRVYPVKLEGGRVLVKLD